MRANVTRFMFSREIQFPGKMVETRRVYVRTEGGQSPTDLLGPVVPGKPTVVTSWSVSIL